MEDNYYIRRLSDIIEDIADYEKITLDDYMKILYLMNDWKSKKENYFNKLGVNIFYLENQIDKIKNMYSYISDDSFTDLQLIGFMNNDDDDNIVKSTYNWQDRHNKELDRKYSDILQFYYDKKYVEAFKELKKIEEYDKDNDDE